MGEILTFRELLNFLCSYAGKGEKQGGSRNETCEIKLVTKSAQFLRFFSSYQMDVRILERFSRDHFCAER